MTTDEIELERDLKTLAKPQLEDEHLRLAIRATLSEQLQPPPNRRRRTRLAVGGVAIAAATAAAAIVALIGVGGSGGPSSANAAILAHLVRATNPPADLIVHVKESGALSDGTQVTAEWWQETNAPYAMRLIKGPAGREVEAAADGATYSEYDPSTNTVYQHADSTSPTVIDPIETLRAELKSGSGQVAGTVTIDGRSLYKLELPNGVVAYFDKTDYRPVYVDNPQRDGGSVVRTRVIAYEELAINSTNDKLLSVAAQHPGARVVSGIAPGPAKSATRPK